MINLKWVYVAMLLLSFSTTHAQVNSNKQGASFKFNSTDVEIQFYSPSIVRVVKTPDNKPYKKSSLVIIKTPDKTNVTQQREGSNLVLRSLALKVVVNETNGSVVFYDLSGKQLLKDSTTTFTPKDDAGTPSYNVKASFVLDADEPVYGVGQVMDNKFNRRNSKYVMKNENTFTYSPYFMSVKGYGVYWDNYSISEYADSPGNLSFQSLGHCADYYFMYGKNADGVIKQIRSLSGKAPMLPLWAYGFFQSKERYTKQEESLEVLQKYRSLKVPIDVIIQDWRYWPEFKGTDSAWNSQRFDTIRFPNPKKWVDDIHKLNARLVIVTWPGFGPKTDQRKELDSKKMILNFDTWPPKSGAKPYDVFNPEALNIYWKYLNERIFSYIGNDGWWLDSTEPDHINVKDADFDVPTHLGSYRSVKNAFSLMHNGGIATRQKAASKNKRVVLLTRSGFVGQQRYGSNTWSGDVGSTWEMLEKQIPAALNYTLMGIPNWNSDIGGFFAGRWNKEGGAKNPKYQELYLRWMQFGTFCPMMRSHGTEVPREIYNFGKRGDWCFDGQEKMINMRYRLLPYIYSTSWDVSHNDGTFMRPLIMDFAADAKTHEIGNQYLFGRSVMVAPVTKPEVSSWPVYLPASTMWTDFWTGEQLTGGQTINKEVPKDIIPMYVKAGSILPWGPAVQYSGEKKWDNLDLRIYPGANGRFTLYEDEKDNYNYEKGSYSTIDISWNDVKKELTISAQKGKYPGMLVSRKFNVCLVKAGLNVGMQANSVSKVVNYNGRQVTISLN
ncbi:TIM-barrel domain-containing protein [uncultured Mucilaginibacter sp.]|uniref:glycoside hydrolase family 31 protein n=1 Tax=uncultured Mucilaginibacter sp. TaxID=797541 RepID=UPI0025D83C2C|nr:TIM-barrel domain-containing protein [uncultured Mucilaginibacter sp.]